MTRELTKKFLQDAGITDIYYKDNEWHIIRYWHKTSSIDKQYKELKVQNAVCRHKYTKDKYYPIITFCVYQTRYCFSLSKLLYAWFFDIVPEGYDVDHIDNNPYNNNLDNLRLLTRGENIAKRFTDNPDGWRNQYWGNKVNE